MKLSTQSHSLIESALKEAVSRFAMGCEQTVVTDIHLLPKQGSGELIIFDDDDEECVSDEILDKFDKTLEEKGLGDDYFRKKEERLKEMDLEHELHEFAIDEMLNE